MFSFSPVIYSFGFIISLSLIYLIAPLTHHHRHHHHHHHHHQQQEFLSIFDDLDDLALFQKASTPAQRLKTAHLSTSKVHPKIAFLFLTNSPLTFAPLWEQLFKGNSRLYNIYVHSDPLSNVPNPGGVFKNKFIPSKKTSRGSASLISAERRLLALAILDDPLNLYFTLVSQHCIPLHSFNFMYSALFGNNRIRAFTSQWAHKSYIEILSKDPNLPDRYNARGDNVMLPEVPFEEFRVGSQFFVMAKRHALVVLRDKKLWRKFKIPCLNIQSCYPEEHYFPTLLSMADPKGCSHYTLTHVNWTFSVDGHPYLYQPLEISPQLVHKLRASNGTYSHFFARKFSPGCLKPLMGIADDVIFRD